MGNKKLQQSEESTDTSHWGDSSYQEQIMNRSKQAKKEPNKYLKYTAIGSEMIGACLFGGIAGQWLDKKVAIKFPVFTIVLILLGLVSVFVHLIRQLEVDRKEEEKRAEEQKNKPIKR